MTRALDPATVAPRRSAKEGAVQRWEYLYLSIFGETNWDGTGRPLANSKEMLVWTSDKRYQDKKMPVDTMGIINQLGDEGWEMVEYVGIAFQPHCVAAVFKRPKK